MKIELSRSEIELLMVSLDIMKSDIIKEIFKQKMNLNTEIDILKLQIKLSKIWEG